MEYRVYDIKEDRWVKDNVYLAPNGDLFKIKQSLFGMVKIPMALDSDRYVYYKSIGLYDKENTLIYEGDYVAANVANNKTVVGIVGFAHELSAYVIFCVNYNEYYTLGSEVAEFVKVIGNVFDGYENEEEQNGQQTLQESET